MNLNVDPNFQTDKIDECLKSRLTLPPRGYVPDPFSMKDFSNKLSILPNFRLIDIFNHLIMSKADYDKKKTFIMALF